MIITILAQKYKVGCKKGLSYIEKPHILSHLNMIIDWSKCEWPEEEKEVEVENLSGEKSTEKKSIPNTGFLGEIPELKPGDCFLIDGQVVAVDSEDRLVLIVSETGAGSLERIWNDIIEPETSMILNTYTAEVQSWEKSKKTEIPSDYEIIPIPYSIYKIWKECFVKKEGIADSDDLCIKVKIESGDLFMPVEVYFLKWSVAVNLEDFMDEDHAKDIVKQAISWFYSYE